MTGPERGWGPGLAPMRSVLSGIHRPPSPLCWVTGPPAHPSLTAHAVSRLGFRAAGPGPSARPLPPPRVTTAHLCPLHFVTCWSRFQPCHRSRRPLSPVAGWPLTRCPDPPSEGHGTGVLTRLTFQRGWAEPGAGHGDPPSYPHPHVPSRHNLSEKHSRLPGTGRAGAGPAWEGGGKRGAGVCLGSHGHFPSFGQVRGGW